MTTTIVRTLFIQPSSPNTQEKVSSFSFLDLAADTFLAANLMNALRGIFVQLNIFDSHFLFRQPNLKGRVPSQILVKFKQMEPV